MELYILVLILVAAVSLWGVISPRSAYWTLTAWKYRNPEANEPSDAAYSVTRVSSALMIVAMLVLIGISVAQFGGESDDDQPSACEQLVDEVNAVWKSGSGTEEEMRRFAEEHSYRIEVSVVPAGDRGQAIYAYKIHGLGKTVSVITMNDATCN